MRIWGYVAVLLGVAIALAAYATPSRASGACLSMPLVFETTTAEGCPDSSRIQALLDAPLAVGPADPETGARRGVLLTAPHDDSRTQAVRTCRAYGEAVRAGWYAATQLEMNSEGFLRVACGALLSLDMSSVATTSRFKDEGVGFDTLSLLPVDILPALSPDTETALANLKLGGFNVGSMIAMGDVLTRSAPDGQLDLAYGGMASTYGEVARGDFNGDGAEDLLVYARHQAVNGSLQWFELFGLSYPAGALTYERFSPEALGQLKPQG
jgi:hypothetical protein